MTRIGATTAGQIDEATIRNNAARAAWGYQTQGIQDTYAAQFARMTATAKTTQALATGGLSAISGPMAMASQAALWQFRYGMKGQPGQPYPTGGNGSGANSESDFWDQG